MNSRLSSLLILLAVGIGLAGCASTQQLKLSESALKVRNEQATQILASDTVYNAPCRIRIKVSDEIVGFRGSKQLIYRLKPIIENMFNNAVYCVFQPPGSDVIEAFTLDVQVFRSQLEVRGKRADYALELLMTCSEPGGKVVLTKRFDKERRTSQISKTDVPDVVFDLVSEAAIEMVQAMQDEPQVKSAVVYYGGRERVATEAEWDSFKYEIAGLSGRPLVDRLALGWSQFTKDIWRREIERQYDEAATVLVTKELTEILTAEGGTPTVIVLNLTAPGGYLSVDGEQWANRLSTRLVQTQSLQVVERERIAQIIREQNFSNTELVEESTRIKLGKLAGASVVIMGSISQALTIKAVDAESGIVLYAITLNRPF